MERKTIIALDVGGTNVTSGLINSEGKVENSSYTEVSINSKGSREEILTTLSKVIEEQAEKTTQELLQGVGIGMPGPFNYERGVSKMEHKFASIYNLVLGDKLRERSGVDTGKTLKFIPDSGAFLLGEQWKGLAKEYETIIGITIGTGLGSAFMKEGKLVTEGDGVPPCAWIGGLPYKRGRVENYVAKKGIRDRYQSLSPGAQHPEVREIARRAFFKKDDGAKRAFHKSGKILREVLLPIVKKFRPQCIVIGGKIARSFELFSEPLKYLLNLPGLEEIGPAKNIILSPLLGAAKCVLLGNVYDPPVLVNCEEPGDRD